MAKAETLLRFSGVCVGNAVVAGRKVSGFGWGCGRKTVDLGKTTLSTVGGVCSRLVPKRRRPAAKVAKPVAEPAHDAPSLPSVTTPRAPRIETHKAETVSAPRPQPTRDKKAAKRKLARASGPRSVERPVRPTSEQVEAAEFTGLAQKVQFVRIVADLEDVETENRVRAAHALGEISHELSVQALSAQLFSDPSASVRKECVNALMALEGDQGLATVEHALSDPDAGVRLAAVMGVYRLGAAGRAAALIESIRDEDAEVRRMAACCIGWLGQEHCAIELAPLLEDGAARVRQAAAEAIGSLGDRRAAPGLIECLHDVDDLVRKKALAAVERITDHSLGGASPVNDEEWVRLQARWRHWWDENGVDPDMAETRR